MNKKEKLNKIKLALSKLLEVQMSYITTDKGILYFEGENLKVDQQVWLKDENEENWIWKRKIGDKIGNLSPIPFYRKQNRELW